MKIVFLYALFAAVATAVNLLTQLLLFLVFNTWWVLYLALLFGTLTGLVTKYVLDKKYIFNYKARNRVDDFNKFSLYSLMGLFTTFIFWGAEMFFYYYFDFKGSQYVGGALGLMVGYIVKYVLDRKYVFKVAV